ncbi:MAG: BatA domain-containing protein [Phycisphaerae bacterium]|nr:BatA domain-containing protein [Phycisphaerae bacterium]
MLFLNPILLFGTAAAAIPIIIHLLNSRKVKRISWAAMRFVLASIEQNRRRLRIEDLLLLLLRCALLILLALALARPAISGAAGGLLGHEATTAIIIVDSSYSMSATDGIHSAFDKAKDRAAQIIDDFPAGSRAAVWLCSDSVNPLIPEPTADLALARSTIAAAQRCDRATDLTPAFRRALDVLKNAGGAQKEIDLITDGQASGWKHLEEIRQLLSASTGVRTNVMFLSSPVESNLAIADLRPAGELMLTNRSIRFAATIQNTGASDVKDVRVTLRIDGGEPIDETIISSLSAGESQTVSLFARFSSEGYHTISATVPADRLPADDTRTIAVRALAGLKLLLVDGDPSQGRDSATFYLQRLFAISGSSEAGDSPGVNATVISPGELSHQSLDGFAAVVLADVASLSGRDVSSLNGYVQRGGGLLVFPGEHVQSSFYNTELEAANHLLPAAFGSPRGDVDANQKIATLQGHGFTHPISELWNDPAAGSPESVNIMKLLPLEPDSAVPVDIAGAPRVVMNFSDNIPAVMERSFGRGRVIQFAIPAAARWDDLPLHPGIFVPLMFRSINAIVSRQDESLNILAGAPFTFHPPAQSLGQQATIFRPGEDAASAHDVRPVELVGREPTLSVDQTDIAGAYTITMADGPAIKFAVQFDPRESIVQPLSASDRQSLASVAHLSDDSSIGNASAETGLPESRAEIWKPLAWAVLVLAAGEMTCAWWFSRSK